MNAKKTKRCALYLRTSTRNGQTTENQRRRLEEVAARAGWKIVAVFEDAGYSGSKGREKRPGLDAMMKEATRRKFDTVLAWSVDRLGRSVQAVSTIMKELDDLGVAQYYDQQALDGSTPNGRAMIQMAVVFSELELEIIRSRIKAGLDRAKAEAKAKGETLNRRGIGKRRARKEAEVLRLREDAQSIRAIAKATGLSKDTVNEIVREAGL